jgi:hypothetical protein
MLPNYRIGIGGICSIFGIMKPSGSLKSEKRRKSPFRRRIRQSWAGCAKKGGL